MPTGNGLDIIVDQFCTAAQSNHNMSKPLVHLPVLELESTHLFRYLSELDPRRNNSGKGGYLTGRITLPPQMLKHDLRLVLSTCLYDTQCTDGQSTHEPHSSLIHVIHKKGNRREHAKETVPNKEHWRREFQLIGKDVYVTNTTSVADEGRTAIPDVDKICSLKGNTITLDGQPSSLHLVLIQLKTEHKARGEELHLDHFLKHQVQNAETRKILQDVRGRNRVKIRLEVFDKHGSLLGTTLSGVITNSSSSVCGPLDIHDVTPLRSCSKGGRKIIMISEFVLAKDVKPAFQLYDKDGNRLIGQEEEMLAQPCEGEISVRRGTITFMTPPQDKADLIMLNKNLVRLVLRRQSDGVISTSKPIFEITPHDFHEGICLLCDYGLDGGERHIPKIVHAQPGVKRRV